MRICAIFALPLLAFAATTSTSLTAPEWAGPESVTFDELRQGVSIYAKGTAEQPVNVWVVSSDPRLVDVSPSIDGKPPVPARPAANAKPAAARTAAAGAAAKPPDPAPPLIQWKSGDILQIDLKAVAQSSAIAGDRIVWISVLKAAGSPPVTARKLTITSSAPRIGPEAYTLFAARGLLSPLLPDSQICFTLPVVNAPLALGTTESQNPAALKNSFGGFGKLTATRTASDPTQLNACLEHPSSGSYTGKYSPIVNGKTTGPVDLTLNVSDGWVLAVFVAALGVFLAWYIKRGINVERSVHVLLRRAALARVKFEDQALPAFNGAIGSVPQLKAFTLSRTPDELWKQVRHAIHHAGGFFTTKIDEKSDDFVRASQQIQLLESLGSGLPALATGLVALTNRAVSVRQEAKLSAGIRPAQPTPEPQPFSDIDAALQGRPIAPEDVSGTESSVGALNLSAARWIREHKSLLLAYSTWKSLKNPAKTAGGDLQKQFDALGQELDIAWLQLWGPKGLTTAIDTDDLLARVQSLLSKLGLESAASMLRLDAEAAPSPTPAEQELKRVDHGTFASEFWLTALALVIAITAGMDSAYLGQAFGSLKQYVELFLWGAGVKTGLDLLTPLLEQFGMAVGKATTDSKSG
jgi:hypothetical protein